MLSVDNIHEIAYRTDYATTMNMLIVFPFLNTDYFFTQKWTAMYNVPALPFFTDQDNFLMMERKVSVAFCETKLYKNILYESEGLRDAFERYADVMLKLIPVHVQKQYVVFCPNHVDHDLAQFDVFYDAESFIESYVKTNMHHWCCIVDMNQMVFSFNRVKLQRKPKHHLYCHQYNPYRFERIDPIYF